MSNDSTEKEMTATATATLTPLRKSRLIMVSDQNNNKFYEMEETADGRLLVRYGRIGTAGAQQEYPIREWDKKYNEKVRKGYVDQTHLFAAAPELEQLFDIQDAEVQRLISDLMRFARKSVSYHYAVSADQVTALQVKQAQLLVNELANLIGVGFDAARFNQLLLDLFRVIPRKMGKVNDHLVTSINRPEDLLALREKISAEQDMLDALSSQVNLNQTESPSANTQKNQNILEEMGLEIVPVTDAKELYKIHQMMGEEVQRFHAAYKVVHRPTEARFQAFVNSRPNRKTQLFWHGSRNENWISILQNGLVLRPTNAVITGKMFGYGIYFADRFRKSLNYTSLRGAYWTSGGSDRAFLALYEVHTGHAYKITRYEAQHGQLNEERLKKINPRYDSVFAEKGADLVNNEFVVYNENQCALRYLVEVV